MFLVITVCTAAATALARLSVVCSGLSDLVAGSLRMDWDTNCVFRAKLSSIFGMALEGVCALRSRCTVRSCGRLVLLLRCPRVVWLAFRFFLPPVKFGLWSPGRRSGGQHARGGRT